MEYYYNKREKGYLLCKDSKCAQPEAKNKCTTEVLNIVEFMCAITTLSTKAAMKDNNDKATHRKSYVQRKFHFSSTDD